MLDSLCQKDRQRTGPILAHPLFYYYCIIVTNPVMFTATGGHVRNVSVVGPDEWNALAIKWNRFKSYSEKLIETLLMLYLFGLFPWHSESLKYDGDFCVRVDSIVSSESNEFLSHHTNRCRLRLQVLSDLIPFARLNDYLPEHLVAEHVRMKYFLRDIHQSDRSNQCSVLWRMKQIAPEKII